MTVEEIKHRERLNSGWYLSVYTRGFVSVSYGVKFKRVDVVGGMVVGR